MCHLVLPRYNQCISHPMLCEPPNYARNPNSMNSVFYLVWKTTKNTKGGTFIGVVCFHEDSPSYIRDVELHNGSNVKIIRRGCSCDMQI